jgi:NTP pyrophosphatase (non-canonical NTP hydrolase)
MAELDLAEVRGFLREWAEERDWGQYHTPKNLAMALAGEVGELLEIFQWLTPEESADVMSDEAKARAVADEVIDILQYVVRIADVLDVDLAEAFRIKFEENARRYPADEVRGSAEKR